MPRGAGDQSSHSTILHGSCVSLSGQGVLIKGSSGSGKSALALQMLAYGCDLVADDRVVVTADGRQLMADAPTALPHLIEARGLGLLPVVLRGPANLIAVVDMDILTTDRLPKKHDFSLFGLTLPLFHRVDGPHFAAALVQMLKRGWHDPE
ncbi:HPr kinase/phosphatase C-terminal domain-containing protein [Tropicibacter sp. R16_0]|uniref:HPr kinase/phosphorylase n=1 Tax=Tropicibacter sp. R16_0 TaxID=2821102 RepID=UPI001ADC0D25|nr:HPr kinase/phosphatase C-terminal domain-containing protein [Tropicibacter sp. R16_0]MBO9452676.1 HPr kinase/phosphatase C-terminal domain-containing protein [Tropicibacter sp. R16_0]